MLFIQMFLTFFKIGLFSFGGGYAAMPLIQSLVIEQNGWLTVAEYADLMTIAEMTPGPIAVNAATFVGSKLSGLVGSIVCTIGCITPSVIIVLLLAYLYKKYANLEIVKGVLNSLRPAVVAMIASAAVTLLLMALFSSSKLADISFGNLNIIELVLFAADLYILRKYKLSPVTIIFSTAFIGTIAYMIIK